MNTDRLLRNYVFRMVARAQDREDVLQQAHLIALRRGVYGDLRFLARDAIREHYGDRRLARNGFATMCLERPDWLASIYPSENALLNRALFEETEDQAEEWLKLPAAERDARRIEAARALGTSPE